MLNLIRSALFVPAHREGWIEKAVRAQPDAVIVDLEDSVPPGEKGSARGRVSAAVSFLRDNDVGALVRPNSWQSGEAVADLEACVVEGVAALLLPKVDSVEELRELDNAISLLERDRSLTPGGIPVVVSLESAAGYLNAAELARGPRVAGLVAVTSKGGDAQRDLGWRPTSSGLETLYYRSHVILAARAARLPHVLTGPWQDFRDLQALQSQAAFNRDLGFTGELLIHPSNVEIVNETYRPRAEEIEYHLGLIMAYEQAAEKGVGAVEYRGDHIDAAHVQTSRAFVERARRLGLDN